MNTIRMRVIEVRDPFVDTGQRMVHYNNGLSVLVPSGGSWSAAVNEFRHPTHGGYSGTTYDWTEDAVWYVAGGKLWL